MGETRNGRLGTQPLGCGRVRPVVRITITPAAYAAIKPSLAKGANQPPPQRDAAGRFVIYVEETYVDQLKVLRRSRENYSDVILRLAETEGTKATVVKLAERG
jgi:hypothetical protein